MADQHLSDPQRRSDLRAEAEEFYQRRQSTGPHATSPATPALRSNGGMNSRHRWYYQRLQFRRMYRYGLSLLLVGALCNWIGFAQHYFAPVRYLGVGCVIAGALCICIALCRWLAIRSNEPSINNHEVSTCGGTGPSIHVIAVPVQGMDHHHHHHPFNPTTSSGLGPSLQQPSIVMMTNKPPDYETAIGSKPPSYDEAVRVNPAVFLQLNTPVDQQQQGPMFPATIPVASTVQQCNNQQQHRQSCCSIDCPRCSSCGNGV